MKKKLTEDQYLELLNHLLLSNDFEGFKLILRDFIKESGYKNTSEKTPLRRETLYSALKPEKKPAFITVKSILNALNLEIIIKKKRE